MTTSNCLTHGRTTKSAKVPRGLNIVFGVSYPWVSVDGLVENAIVPVI